MLLFYYVIFLGEYKIMAKTNALRLLENAGIHIDTMEYEVDENDLSGVHIADVLGIDPDCVFKTLVCRDDKNAYFVFCIPVAYELDLKKCAVHAGVKRIEMIHVKELLPLTGYIRGGCSPVGMKKKFPTYFDSSAATLDKLTVSAGMKGAQLLLDAKAIVAYTEAMLCDIAIDPVK